MLKDVKFRQALNWAVDRDKIVSPWSGGGTTTARHHHHSAELLQGPRLDRQPPAETAYKFDPAKANQLLDEAGYKDSDGNGIRGAQGQGPSSWA